MASSVGSVRVAQLSQSHGYHLGVGHRNSLYRLPDIYRTFAARPPSFGLRDYTSQRATRTNGQLSDLTALATMLRATIRAMSVIKAAAVFPITFRLLWRWGSVNPPFAVIETLIL